MARSARKKSESGMYHAMLRGINKQIIFEDEEDKEKFLQVLKDCKEISGFELFAYCLMGNHLHLLLKVKNEELEQIFKRIGVRYVYWYNLKYNRSGHLFQDRFKSEPVDDDPYFLTVLRYIHQNPVKANMCNRPEQYKWSSYNDYYSKQGVTDIGYALKLFGENREEAQRQFKVYSEESNQDVCLDAESSKQRTRDEEALKIIKCLCSVKNATELQKMDAAKRDNFLLKLKENGLSIRQISRLTGISFGVVRRN